MRSIPIAVLALAVAVCRFAASGTAFGAASNPGQAPTAPPADCCAAVTATPSAAVDLSAKPARHQADVTASLAQRRPGFWTAANVGSESVGSAADPPTTVLPVADTPPPAGAAACQSYPLPVVVGGQQLQATVVACPQPDGSWQVTQYTPGLPPQVYTMPAPQAAGAFPDDYSSWGYYSYWGLAGSPWFWGFAPAIVVVQVRFHAFGQGFAQGFGHGFAHGFSHGLAGFAHGFAVGPGAFGGMRR